MDEVKITTDIFFRYLFAQEGHSHLLLSFINAVLCDAHFTPIKSVEILNPFNIAERPSLKESVVDVKATDESGRIYDIEVQVSAHKDFAQPSLYYWAKNYAGQLEKGKAYGRLKPVICINILDFILIAHTKRVHTCFMVRDINDTELFMSDHLSIHFIQLPLITDELKKQVTEALCSWLHFF